MCFFILFWCYFYRLSFFLCSYVYLSLSLIDCCERLFDLFTSLCAESGRKKILVWPLQMMLLVLCPKILEEINNAENGAPLSPEHQKKKQFMDEVRDGNWFLHCKMGFSYRPVCESLFFLFTWDWKCVFWGTEKYDKTFACLNNITFASKSIVMLTRSKYSNPSRYMFYMM